MSDLALAILAITGLFGLLLVAKQALKLRKLCAICAAVSSTWAALLGLSWLELFNNRLIIGILIGQSSLAAYYWLDKRAAKELRVFRLPVLLTLVLVTFSLVALSLPLDALLIVGSVWLAVGLSYAYRKNPAVKNKFKALVECCSNW